MQDRDDPDRKNSNITGEYTIASFKANGRFCYYNDKAKRYLYSSEKGVWFVRKQYHLKAPI